MSKISGVCVGESLVGEGNEVAHVDLLIGPRGSAVETAYCNALTNNKDGFTTLLALVAPNLMCKPPTILYNKVTIKDARQAVQMFGPAQHAVAKAVADSVAEGVIPANEADDLYITVGVFIHWEAKDNQKIQDFKLSRHQGSHRSCREGRAEVFRGHRKEGLGSPSVCRQLKRRTSRSGQDRQTTGPDSAVAKEAGFLDV
jgi:5,6,7,8-tetrahydromethanopterin hydro-lyase